MKKKQFYLLPFEIEGKGILTPGFLKTGYKKAGSPPVEIQKKRDEIFTSELESVISRVMGGEKESGSRVTKELDIWLKSSMPDDTISEIMEEVYFRDEITADNVKKCLTDFFARHGVFSFSINLLNEKSGCYYPVIFNGLDDLTSINFIFTFQCEYLKGGNGFIQITEEMKENIFFRKKYSPADIERFGSIEAINLNEKGLEAYCFVFHEKETESRELLQNQVTEFISPLMPALNHLNDHLNSLNNVDNRCLLINVYNSFKQFIYNGTRECLVHKVSMENYDALADGAVLKKEIIKSLSLILDRTNMIVEDKIDGFILFTRSLEQKELMKIIHNPNINYALKTFRYPDNGTNLFTYFY